MYAERQRLSLSLKCVEGGAPVQARPDGAEPLHTTPNLDLSEEVFKDSGAEGIASSAEPTRVADVPPEDVPPEPEAGPLDPDLPTEVAADSSLDADRIAPEEQGPGDSEGVPPLPPADESA